MPAIRKRIGDLEARAYIEMKKIAVVNNLFNTSWMEWGRNAINTHRSMMNTSSREFALTR